MKGVVTKIGIEIGTIRKADRIGSCPSADFRIIEAPAKKDPAGLRIDSFGNYELVCDVLILLIKQNLL